MSASRANIAQQAPDPKTDLTGFPSTAVDFRTDQFGRAHRKPNDAHWRSSSGDGRFDLESPEGTCYVAETLSVAVREWLGPAGTRGVASQADCDALEVTILDGIQGVAAEVSVPEAAPFGITSELTSMTPYDIPRAWARRFRAEGFDAVRYTPRFTPGPPTALALFGPAGTKKVGNEVRRVGGPEALAETGVTVLPVPPAGKLSTI